MKPKSFKIDISTVLEKRVNEATPICEHCQQVTSDYNKLRLVGDDLALAAFRVVKNYDGIHRLRLAISKWIEAVANEGRRGDV